jgi:hypothetical protein
MGNGITHLSVGTSLTQAEYESTDAHVGGTGRTATYVVAASDALAHVKAQADYVCDGTADEVEIGAAQTAGKDIYLSEGSFHITATQLAINSQTNWQGAGMYRTYLYADVASILSWYKYGITMRGLTIISTTAKKCLEAYSNYNNLFERVRFVSNINSYTGIVVDAGTEHGQANGYNNRYTNCIFERTGTGAMTTLYFNNSDDSLITDCKFIGLAGESSVVYIFGNRTEISSSIFSYSHVSLQKNTGSGVLNNYIYDAPEMGIGGTGLVINPRVIGNHIERSAENGIDLGGAYGALIKNNVVLASGLFHTGGVPSEGFGICYWAVNSICEGNYVAFSYKDGIGAGGSPDTKLSILGNVCENNGLGGETGLGWGTGYYIYGVRVYTGTDNVIISGNRLLDTQNVGSSLLSAQAASGQKNITVTDASIFKRYQAITISDDTPQTEDAIISAINTTTDVITVIANLTNTYTLAQNAIVTGKRTGGGLHLEAGITNLVCEGNDLSNNLGNDIGAGLTCVQNNNGYIAPGEVRTVSGTLTGGAENTIVFAWHNPEAQDILIKKVVVNVTTADASAANIDVGIADDATYTNGGTEFFNDLAGETAQLNDSWVAGDGGAQTKWVLCQDSASATDGWVVGKALGADATDLVGSYYIEYTGK